MTKKGRKTWVTVLIIIVSLIVYGFYMYIRASDGKFVPSFTGVLFALIPAILINIIWNKKSKKVKKSS
ncbi:hypothetical protein [Lutibacter sp.]|uniref:hypothetical protein n=1 Tax=Lutibacter sp. TaxID=1925666 RepID=UPI0027324337|nr:hypothetical protein [Lutibacter sp.]MDP3313750.1 hypothetical protein [Lutibacter sp.]